MIREGEIPDFFKEVGDLKGWHLHCHFPTDVLHPTLELL
jgi:hypothetical protein